MRPVNKGSILAEDRLRSLQGAIPGTFTRADGRVLPTTDFQIDSLNLADAAFGFQLNPASTFLVTFNVLVKLNSAGLGDDALR